MRQDVTQRHLLPEKTEDAGMLAVEAGDLYLLNCYGPRSGTEKSLRR